MIQKLLKYFNGAEFLGGKWIPETHEKDQRKTPANTVTDICDV
jgi:hypothetical protein